MQIGHGLKQPLQKNVGDFEDERTQRDKEQVLKEG
jgi:hypothetical protein